MFFYRVLVSFPGFFYRVLKKMTGIPVFLDGTGSLCLRPAFARGVPWLILLF